MARNMLYYVCLVLAVSPFVRGDPENADRTVCVCPPEWTESVPEIPDASDETGNAVCEYIEDNNLMTECAQTRTACGSQEGVKFCCCYHASSFRGMHVCFGESKPEYVCVPQDITRCFLTEVNPISWEDGLHAAIAESHTPTQKRFRTRIGGLIHKKGRSLKKLQGLRKGGIAKSAMKKLH